MDIGGTRRRAIGRRTGAAVLLVALAGCWLTGLPAPVRAEEAAAAGQPTIQQCFEDIEYLRLFNRLEPTVEQLSRLVEIVGALDLQRRQAETTRSQPAPQALLDARMRLLRGESPGQVGEFELLGEQLGQQLALAEQALHRARQDAATQLRTLFTQEQLRRFARSEGPLRRVDDLMAELAVSRALPEDEWVRWQQRVVPRIVEMVIERDPKAVKAPFEVVSKLLEEARALSDDQFNAQKDALTQRLEQLVLPANFTPEDPAQTAERLGWFLLERPRSATLLQEVLKARQGG